VVAALAQGMRKYLAPVQARCTKHSLVLVVLGLAFALLCLRSYCVPVITHRKTKGYDDSNDDG